MGCCLVRLSQLQPSFRLLLRSVRFYVINAITPWISTDNSGMNPTKMAVNRYLISYKDI